MNNYQSLFRVIDLKLDIEPSLVCCQCWHSVCSAACTAAYQSQWAVAHSNEYSRRGGAYRRQLVQ